LANNTSGSFNTAFGTNALFGNTTASNNTAVGYQALYDNTTGQYNVAIGESALANNTTADSNTAVGKSSLVANTIGNNNTTIGKDSLASNTTGNYNTAVGSNALVSNTTASNNTTVGDYSLNSNTTGLENTAIGSRAMIFNTTGGQNVGIGRRSLEGNTTGSQNTTLGHSAGFSTTTAEKQTFIGQTAGYYATGGLNTFVGQSAGSFVTTGANNTILGRYNGNQNGLDIRTSSNNIVLSDGDGEPRFYYTTATVNWKLKAPAVSNNALIINSTGGSDLYGMQIDLNVDMNNSSNWFFNARGNGAARFRVYTNGNVVNTNNSYGSISDVKLKENIVDSGSQWDDIKALTVRKYSMKADNLDAPNMIGVIAQEVEAAGMGGLVFETPDATPDNPDAEGTTKQVNYSVLYMKAVKALQEAMDRIETLEAKVTALENA
jgi:hypothetical protein